jgi:hypothetical protein
LECFFVIQIPGTEKLKMPRIDHTKAVKKYHRPAAGNEIPLPEDVRPSSVLMVTINILNNYDCRKSNSIL